MAEPVLFSLSYTGSMADYHEIDLYDIAHALVGFQRSLALTTHLVLNGEIITQATALKGARIIAPMPEAGSWKIDANIVKAAAVASAIYTMGTAPPDTPVGHVIGSVYDYVVHETMGFHVDYGKSLGEQIEEYNKKNAFINLTYVRHLATLSPSKGESRGKDTDHHRFLSAVPGRRRLPRLPYEAASRRNA